MAVRKPTLAELTVSAYGSLPDRDKRKTRVKDMPEIAPKKRTEMPRGISVDAPYDPEIGILPHDELMRRLQDLFPRQILVGKRPTGNRITLRDFANECLLTCRPVEQLRDGSRDRLNIGPEKRRRISQVLLRIEAGLFYKQDGEIVRKRPEPLKRPPIHRHVLFSPSGRVIIAQGEGPGKPRPMPKLLVDWGF